MKRRLRSQAGFTMIELVVASTLGMIVMFAGFVLLDRSFLAASEVADRQDTLQRGRQAMLLIERQLRSQVCLGTASSGRPLIAAGDDSVSFHTDLSDGDVPTAQQRTLRYDAASQSLIEDVYEGTGTYPNLVFPGTPTRSSTLLTNVGRISGGPIFRYHRFADDPVNGATVQLTGTPLSSSDRARTVKVSIGFVALPLRAAGSSRRTTHFRNQVYVRSADPNNPTGGPRCV